VFLRLALKVVTQNDGDFFGSDSIIHEHCRGIISMFEKMTSDILMIRQL
jgi:hypothetical protein